MEQSFPHPGGNRKHIPEGIQALGSPWLVQAFHTVLAVLSRWNVSSKGPACVRFIPEDIQQGCFLSFLSLHKISLFHYMQFSFLNRQFGGFFFFGLSPQSGGVLYFFPPFSPVAAWLLRAVPLLCCYSDFPQAPAALSRHPHLPAQLQPPSAPLRNTRNCQHFPVKPSSSSWRAVGMEGNE